MISRFRSWLSGLFHQDPTPVYVPDEDPDVIQFRKQRLESVRETQKFLRHQQRQGHNVVELALLHDRLQAQGREGRES